MTAVFITAAVVVALLFAALTLPSAPLPEQGGDASAEHAASCSDRA